MVIVQEQISTPISQAKNTHPPCPKTSSGALAIDLSTYPINTPDSPGYSALVDTCRAQLGGPASAAVVKGFLSPDAVQQMVDEAVALRDKTWPFDRQRTAWGPFPDPSFPEDHVRNRMQQDESHMIAGDLIDEDTLNKQIYRWPALTTFIADCLKEDVLYTHADPFQCLNISFIEENGVHIWHFDPADFVVSILLQKADEGGAFEYVPGLRDEDQNDYDTISAVIDGDHPSINTLSVDPGDLVLFRGRNTLHRVSAVTAGGPRIIALLGFAREPNLVSSPERDAFNYGPRVHDLWDEYGLPRP